MPPGEGLLTIDEGDGVGKDGGESDLPHGHGLWSLGHRSWLARGSGPMALADLSLDLAQ